MSSLKSKTTPHPTKNPSLRWTDLEIQQIVAWLGYRDELGELSNFDLYQTGNKTTAAEKLLYDTGIAETKSGVTKEKARDYDQALQGLEGQSRNYWMGSRSS